MTDQVRKILDCYRSENPSRSGLEVWRALHKKSDQSANGAKYNSQGQARSASPLVCDNCQLTRPERPK